MNHGLILPILLPLFTGSALLLMRGASLPVQRGLSLLASWALLPLAIWLALLAGDGELRLYVLGDWQPPFGIVLLLDRLSAVMLIITALLAGFSVLYALRGDDERGADFHALFQFQLVGINGAFLTGDLFNLFVFFEILLISSYALLLHGQGPDRVRAGLHYVVLNLVGSSLFLLGVSVLYGLTGTLNMADLAIRVAAAPAEDAPLLRAAGFLLLVVFGLKAAIIPLHTWLPSAYSAASAPVAALFAIMTKIGLYAILRVFTLIFGSAGPLDGMIDDWIWPLALATLAIGAFGALAARDLRMLLAHLVIVSVGTLLAGFALGSAAALSASLYYLIHSSLVSGGLFLLADLIVRQRGATQATLRSAPALRQPLLLGAMFFAGAVSVSGLPPFSGFIGKVMLMRSAVDGPDIAWLWAVLLTGGLAMLIALSRAGSLVFWRANEDEPLRERADPVRLLACLGLLSASLLMVVYAGPLQGYLQATADQLLDLGPYLRLIPGGGA
ncbi:monovalent cation/H+ antiporter subunit D [Stutzerimonas urumqiensis]|uniref:monovalent cation/H+ antiporter subunit D n=1 Tax=Stutzerimonas urumqiensis TaxID=638269 RepID=UPI003DA438F4